MTIESQSIALQAATRTAQAAAPSPRARSLLLRAAGATLSLVLAAALWRVFESPPYKPGSAFGYALGVTGGSLLLFLLLYPLRKHARCLQEFGRLKHWFRAHMIGGVLGPVLILFHSTFRVGSFNAGVALGCMLLVVASGIAGRFLYRRVHHGLYGSRATLREAQQTLHVELATLEPALRALPQLRYEIERFAALAAADPPGWRARAAGFVTLGWRRAAAWHRVCSTARRSVAPDARMAALLGAIDRTLRAAQQTAQLSTYERLFALWHAVHIPFLCMLVITAIIHVVAVHAY